MPLAVFRLGRTFVNSSTSQGSPAALRERIVAIAIFASSIRSAT